MHKVSSSAIFFAVYLFLSFFIPVADTAAKNGVFVFYAVQLEEFLQLLFYFGEIVLIHCHSNEVLFITGGYLLTS